MHSKLPPIIAVIGSDGSGKSTVCEHLIDHVQKYGPAVRVHLGKQAGNVERAVVKLPFLGKSLNKAIKHNKVKATKSLPGPIPGLVVMSFVYRRVRRFRHMLALRKQGMIILADRYPQVQIPGGYDGPVFPVNAPGSAFVKWLASREMKAFQWMASQKPDLVIKLNVDLDVACARKPDHRPEALALKVAVTPQLKFEGSQVVNVDANKPLDDVILHAQEAVSKFMEAQGYSLADAGEAVASH